MGYKVQLKTWKVFATDDVEEDLSEFVQYLLFEKMSEQAANAVLEDYDETLGELEKVAGSLKLVDNPGLASLGYRRIYFKTTDNGRSTSPGRREFRRRQRLSV